MDELRVGIKFCGMTRFEDMMKAVQLGVDAIGIILIPGTPRYLEPDHARRLLLELPPFLSRVGVVADQPAEETRKLRDYLGLSAVQLHGNESPDEVAEVGGHVIKTFRVDGNWTPARVESFPCQSCLLEARVPGSLGGSGVPVDWKFLASRMPSRPTILAGGLSPENVEEAIRLVRPQAVDVSSGVECSPGIKDMGLMEAFVEAVERACP